MSSNPFTVGKPVPYESFIGRATEIETAFDQIMSRSNLAIWGCPGIGRSSFLELLSSSQVWQLQGHDPSSATIVSLSCASFNPFNAANFWKEVLSQIRDALDSEPDLQAEVSEQLKKDAPSKDCLRQVLRHLGKKNRFLVLLIDDYHEALRPQANHTEEDIANFLSDCRNLACHAKERQYLSMVVASLRRLNDLGPKLQPGSSPWYNHYLFLPLKPFQPTDVTALLGCMPMTTALREGIQEMCGGHPALLQHAGHLLYRELRTGRVPDPETFARGLQSATEQFFEAIWSLSSDIEQTLMMLIALLSLRGRLVKKRYDLGEIEIIFSQKERELADLEEWGVVMRQVKEGKPIYSFASSVMEWWVVKEIENSNEQWLKERQKFFLYLMSHKQAEKVSTAIRWLWQHKDQVPSLLEWFGKVTTAFPKGLIQG